MKNKKPGEILTRKILNRSYDSNTEKIPYNLTTK